MGHSESATACAWDSVLRPRAHHLLVSAGFDCHGPPGQIPVMYPAETCHELLERLGAATLG